MHISKYFKHVCKSCVKAVELNCNFLLIYFIVGNFNIFMGEIVVFSIIKYFVNEIINRSIYNYFYVFQTHSDVKSPKSIQSL